ncbi:MAG: DPP IV N-terminal domain-containing protein, partial [Planctomycetota bacterium]
MRSTLSALLLSAAGLLALPAQAAPTKQALRYPSLTPDGKQVVFCYRGDIWIAPADGKGQTLRLTLHEAQETLPRVSPDGKLVAFCSRRNGNYDIFTVPVSGGVPKQITFHGGGELTCEWSPDGKKILFVSGQAVGNWGMDLWEVDLKGGNPRRVTFDGGRDACYSPDGSKIVYARGFNTIYWDDYEGSANYDLYVADLAGGLPRRLTRTEGNERYPFFSKDGKTIYFVAQEKGVANFYAMPFEGGKRVQLTKYDGSDVHRPDMGWDLKTVVFELVGQLYTVDLTAPAEKPTPLKITVRSDVRNSGIERRTITSGGEQVHLSQDGHQVVFTLRGDIWTMPAAGGQGAQITKGPHNDQWPRFSPDGSKIAYYSNATGNDDIFLHDRKTKATRQITKNKAGDFFHNWSPDGRQLVFTSERSGNRDIWLVDLESGQTTQLTRDPAGDDDPSFSPDGRFIAFDSAREGSQAIYIMNADGTNVRRVSQDPGFLQVPAFSPDGRLLVYETMSPMTGRSGGLFVVSASGGPSMRISRDGRTACWSPTGDYIYFTEDRGPRGNGIWRVRAPKNVARG